MIKHYKSYRIRIYPTKEQELKMHEHIDACRFLWNYMIEQQQLRYKNGEKHLTYIDMTNLLKPIKNDGEHDWLYKISNTSLQQTCKDLMRAYERFFNKISKYPKFKSKKKCKLNYPARSNEFYFYNDKILHIEKIGKVKYKTDFNFNFGRCSQKFSDVRISYKNGKWFVTFSTECENQAQELSEINMGIDLGVKDLATVEFDGNQIVYHNINKSRKMKNLNKKLIHINRSISRKYEKNKQGDKFIKTNNIMKEEEKLRRIHTKIANIRRNYIHQTTHELISMLPKRIVVEKLNVSGMMKNRCLSKAIAEQCLYEFARQIKYKCEWNGIEFIQADRFFPSSKLCSGCGCIKINLKLSDRTYICNECGLIIDRDYNAAINLSRYIA